MLNQSKYDMDRETVGAIYRHAQLYGEKQITTGDMNYELVKCLADDVNDTIKQGTVEFEGNPFYITVHDHRDLQMKNAFLRRMLKTVYRPWPEDDTLVFKVIPSSNHVYFCWDLPHRSMMINELMCPDLYDPKQLALYKRWENLDLEHFGFCKNDEGNWIANDKYTGDLLLEENVSYNKRIIT